MRSRRAATGGTARVRDFQLAVDTNCRGHRLPRRLDVAQPANPHGRRLALQWTFTNLLSGQAIGVTLPEKLNPGPFAARVTFFAPVGLLFFLR